MLGESLDFLPRFLDTEDRRVGQFARVLVLTCPFAGVFARLFDIDEVIDDLEHESDRIGVSRDGCACFFGPMNAQDPDPAGRSQEGTGLVGVDGVQFLVLGEGFGQSAEGIVHLTGDHPGGSLRQFPDDGQFRVVIVGCAAGDEVKGEGEHGIAREDGHGFARVDVQRGSSATKVVVVHGRQVIVDEAEGVDEFNGPGSGQGRLAVAARRDGAVPGQHGPEPFPPAEEGIANGIEQDRG